jgi:CRP/FNR family cyclic AMP-dependent transcriptional regulator
MDVREILKRNRLFEKFSDTGVARIPSVGDEREFPPDTPIFVENMLGESLFIVARGEVVFRVQSGQESVELDRIGPGEHFGQLCLIKPGPRRVGAVAAGDCVLIEIARRPFLKLQAQKPQACLKLLLAICEDYVDAAGAAAGLMRTALGLR